MEDYYIKYAKPLDDLSIAQVQSQLKLWERSTKEEIDVIIFIENGIKKESMNSLNHSTKLSILSILDQLKSFGINVLENISELLREISIAPITEVNHQLYSTIELIRNEYNTQLQNNQQTIVSSEILLDLKDKYYKMKQVLNEPMNEEYNEGIDYYNNSKSLSKYSVNKPSTKSKIPKLDFNSIQEAPTRNDNTSNRFVYKKIGLPYQRQNEANGLLENNYKDNNNTNEYNQTNIRPISQRNKHPKKYTKAQSYVNVFDIPHCNNPIQSQKDNKGQVKSSAIDSYQTIQKEVMIMQEEIQKLKKKKKKKTNLLPSSKLNDEYVLKLQTQNNQMWNEMSNMRKDICELTNTVLQLSQKINEITEDNQKINQHNEKLTQYIKNLTQLNTTHHHQMSKAMNNNNTTNDNVRNDNKYINRNNNFDEIIHSLPLSNQYNSDNNGGIDSNNEYSVNLITNENDEDQNS